MNNYDMGHQFVRPQNQYERDLLTKILHNQSDYAIQTHNYQLANKRHHDYDSYLQSFDLPKFQ
jgi:hypothetical protein